MSLMELFADPSTFDTLSIGEKVLASLVTALLGMGTTFTVLILIWGFIALTGRIVRKEEAVFHRETPPAPAAAPAAAPAPAAETQDADAALIAVIMAAIAASEGSTFVNNLVVRKIRRIPGPDPTWSSLGRQESLDSRRV
jgi:glutaconyl-CoA/methylmalonyl-CoA decarboxylase subunit delta